MADTERKHRPGDCSNMPVLLGQNEVARAADVCAAAFFEGPYTRFLFPDLQERARHMRDRFYRMLSHAVVYGEVYATSDQIEGVMSLVPDPPASASLWRRLRACNLPGACCSRPVRERVAHGAAYLNERRGFHMPGPHLLLETLAVRPELQGRGFAGALLRHALARADADALPLYLDTFTAGSVEMYRHFGFDVLETGRINGMDSPVYLMRRQPAPLSVSK